MEFINSFEYVPYNVPGSVNNDGGGFWGSLGSRAKNMVANVAKSFVKPLPTGSSPTTPVGKDQDGEVEEDFENISREEVDVRLEDGQSVIKNIYENSEPRFENQTAIIHLMNFLYEKAGKKAQVFDEGTYVLADPDKKLFQALRKFEGAYRRPSSHSLGDKASQSKHYGIDLPASTIQPLDKKHILFFSYKDMRGQQKLFLKPENYGVRNPTDALSHTGEYIKSLAERTGLIDREASQQVHRKERVKYLTGEGEKIVQDFKDCIAKLEDQEKVNSIQKQVNDQGIWRIWSWLNEHVEQVSGNQKLLAIRGLLEEKFDHLDCRTANEVIFSLEELMQAYDELPVD